ncbi:MAG: histidine phosphatase family protein [Chitinophagaceae bacterium]
MKYFLLAIVIMALSCSSNRYFVVRHAEKAIVTKDSSGYSPANPPLSEAGQVRAFVLREELKNKHIKNIYATNYFRTISTAQPLDEYLKNIPIQFYSPSKDSLNDFIQKVLSIKNGNSLIIGHSNTIDDIVNKLAGDTKINGDLKDSEYDNLYIITRKGKKMTFSQLKYGYPSAPEK